MIFMVKLSVQLFPETRLARRLTGDPEGYRRTPGATFVGGTQAATGMLAAIVSTLIMVQGIILVLLELRGRRRGLP